MRVGIFELQDGVTEERAHRFAETILAINYPWWRIVPALWNDPDEAVVVKWDALRQGVTGLFLGSRLEIHLSERENDSTIRSEPFVIAHEVGHLVDHATFTREDRAALTQLFHDSPETYRERPAEWSHESEHSEAWRGHGNHYFLRLNEAYADAFIAAFAPSLYWGRGPRFAHWTEDFEKVRELTLERPIMVYEDVNPEDTHHEGIVKAAELGLMHGTGGGRFDPLATPTRAQLATVSVRLYERIMEEVRAELGRSQA